MPRTRIWCRLERMAQETVPDQQALTAEELGLAARNHAMPLEALRYPVTPVGMHYLLTHFDIPVVDPRDVAAVRRGPRRPAARRCRWTTFGRGRR